jgi:peptide/nickel transport system substrate-binding protein
VRIHKGKAALACAAVAALAVAGCSSSGGGNGNGNGGGNGGGNSGGNNNSSSSSGGKSGGTLIYGESTGYPEDLQPLISAGNSTAVANLEVRLMDGPYRITPKFTFEADPDQISSGSSQVVNGQQVVDLKLNPKAVWADGKPITSADYVFTWKELRSSDPKKGGCSALLSTTGFDQMQGAKAVSKDEVKFTFEKGKPYADWKGLFVGAPLSKHVFDKGSAKANCAYIKNGWKVKDGIPLGAQNGPWLLKPNNINVQNKTFTEVHNPKYWGNPPKLDKLVDAYIGSNPDANVKALQNHEVNMVYPQPQLDLVSNLKKLSGVTTEINFGIAFEHFDFNVKDPLLAHRQIREAIAHAIDRKALVQATVGKFSDKATILDNHLLMGNQPGYKANGSAYDKQNLAKAKSLLKGIGCKVGSASKPTTCFGKPLNFKVITTQDNPLRDSTITVAAQQVKAIGITLKEFADPNIFNGPKDAHSLASEQFQISLFAWVGGPAVSENAPIYLSPKGGGVGQNYSQGGTPQIDAALNHMTHSTTTQEELKYANKADVLLWKQMYTLPLYQKPTLLAFDSDYNGIADNATQVGPLWNSDTFSKS